MNDLVDFKYLSDNGLLWKINKEILHPLGLALSRDPITGKSDGAYVADDGVWTYPQKVNERNEAKYNAYLAGR